MKDTKSRYPGHFPEPERLKPQKGLDPAFRYSYRGESQFRTYERVLLDVYKPEDPSRADNPRHYGRHNLYYRRWQTSSSRRHLHRFPLRDRRKVQPESHRSHFGRA